MDRNGPILAVQAFRVILLTKDAPPIPSVSNDLDSAGLEPEGLTMPKGFIRRSVANSMT